MAWTAGGTMRPNSHTHDTPSLPSQHRRKRRASNASDEPPSSNPRKRRKSRRPSARRARRLHANLSPAPQRALKLFVFGAGDGGELGLGPNGRNASKPRLNHLLDPADPSKPHVAQFSCGGMHTVALTTDNRIVTWGVNDNGALGRHTAWEGVMRDAGAESSDEDDEMLNPHESTPTAISEGCFTRGTKFVQVAAGDSCTFALTTTGTVYGWGTFRDPEGRNQFGYDAAGTLIETQPSPIQIPGLKDVTRINCGANHALALDRHGAIWAWGAGHQNQLGRPLLGRISDGLTPHRVDLFGQKAKYIASGDYHSLAVDTKDNVWAWGLNNYGQAGDPSSAGTDMALLPHPVKVKELCGRGVATLDGGAHHSVAVTNEGDCFTWGRIDSGQLGLLLTDEMRNDPSWIRCDERQQPRLCLRPTKVEGVGKVVQAACGTDHTIFTSRDGLAYSTGFGPMGQLGLGAKEEVKTALQVKSKHIDGKALEFVGAGGQFSIVAA